MDFKINKRATTALRRRAFYNSINYFEKLFSGGVDQLFIAGIIARAKLDPKPGSLSEPAFHGAKERHVIDGT